MHDPFHPFWVLIRLWGGLGFFWLVLWLTATDFDETEISTLFLGGGGLLAAELVQWRIVSYLKAKGKQ